ncbi:hypothetical protein LXL04_017100 [Taraxacum kok-saghyz]
MLQQFIALDFILPQSRFGNANQAEDEHKRSGNGLLRALTVHRVGKGDLACINNQRIFFFNNGTGLRTDRKPLDFKTDHRIDENMSLYNTYLKRLLPIVLKQMDSNKTIMLERTTLVSSFYEVKAFHTLVDVIKIRARKKNNCMEIEATDGLRYHPPGSSYGSYCVFVATLKTVEGVDRDKLLTLDNISSIGLFVLGGMALAARHLWKWEASGPPPIQLSNQKRVLEPFPKRIVRKINPHFTKSIYRFHNVFLHTRMVLLASELTSFLERLCVL